MSQVHSPWKWGWQTLSCTWLSECAERPKSPKFREQTASWDCRRSEHNCGLNYTLPVTLVPHSKRSVDTSFRWQDLGGTVTRNGMNTVFLRHASFKLQHWSWISFQFVQLCTINCAHIQKRSLEPTQRFFIQSQLIHHHSHAIAVGFVGMCFHTHY